MLYLWRYVYFMCILFFIQLSIAQITLTDGASYSFTYLYIRVFYFALLTIKYPIRAFIILPYWPYINFVSFLHRQKLKYIWSCILFGLCVILLFSMGESRGFVFWSHLVCHVRVVLFFAPLSTMRVVLLLLGYAL